MQKAQFWTHFAHCLKKVFFFLFSIRTQYYCVEFQQKNTSGFQAILVSDGRTDEQAWIWRTLRAKALGPKRENSNEREQRLFEFWQIVSLELNFPFNFHIQHFCWKTWGTSIQSFRYYTTDIKKCMEILYDNWLPWQCLKDSAWLIYKSLIRYSLEQLNWQLL